ncbi:MAG: glycoside hydrolase [Spirochaetes bacterium]|nr:MAG: glycoside hydrolase [Spirochaetota bacterium]
MKPLFLSLLLAILLLSCSTTTDKINIVPETAEAVTEVAAAPENPEDSEKSLPPPAAIERPKGGEQTEEEILRTIMNSMSLEEKIGQLFILQIRYNWDGSPRRKVDEELNLFLRSFKPGGIIFFRENIVDNSQVEDLISSLQNLSRIPLFISVDEEGGLVSRLGKAPDVDVTLLPPALSIGAENDSGLAYNAGLVLGRELRAMGVNMDMAPVADVNTNPENPVIGNRAYSSDPLTAGKMVAEVIRGFHKYDIASVIKHFPGHGDTSFDTHVGTVVLPFSRDRLDKIEFIPFELGIEAGTDAIMTAHIVMSGISALPLPATLNPEIITGIIREELGFDGLIISDALNMGAISGNYSPGDSAVAGIKAGLDILLMPEDEPAAFEALLDAVHRGNISEKRIDESVYRILRTKYDRKILFPEPAGETIEEVQNDPAHQALIQTFSG